LLKYLPWNLAVWSSCIGSVCGERSGLKGREIESHHGRFLKSWKKIYSISSTATSSASSHEIVLLCVDHILARGRDAIIDIDIDILGTLSVRMQLAASKTPGRR
jgi:hypothetical protein